MVDTIEELTALSRKLNEKSDKLNEVIASINEKLVRLNFGLEVWVENTPIQSGDLSKTDDKGNATNPHRDAVLLGYCRTADDKWQLAVKDATLVTLVDHYGNEYVEVQDSVSPEPLLKSRRDIRAKAMRLIPMVLDEIKAEASSMLESIDDAEKAAAKL